MLVKELIEKLKEMPLEKKESADRFIEDVNHTVVELVKHMK